MLKEEEKQEIIKTGAKVFVYFGGLVTLAFAIYYIIDLLKDLSHGG
jgi:hypothetical protein